MASWTLVPSLVKLRSEFNTIAPNRDKSSDGSVGDVAHQSTNSDHNPDETSDALRDHDADSKNEVHAIDVDIDLRVPGLSMEEIVQFLVRRCRSGTETRLKYIIFNRRIWSASRGWIQYPYSGSNPHDHHAHFSGKYDTKSEASEASYGLEDEFMAVDYNMIRTIVREEVDKRVDALVASLDVPTADDNGAAALRALRTSPTVGMSDTGANLIVSQVTAAISAGKVIEPYPNNVGKTLGELK